jgi:hypothetical protein
MTKLFLYYHNNSHRGPGMVVKNLLKGLSMTDIEITRDLSKADLVGCLQHPGNEYNKLPSTTMMGPNIFVLPNEEPEIWSHFNNYVVPSKWVKNIYETFGQKNINVWPVGIDSQHWVPTNKNKTLDCFIYYKNRPKEDLVSVVKTLKLLNQSIKIIQYGSYQESDLKELCNEAKYCVLLTDTESQGIAVGNILSMNVPCLVWDKTFWEYKGSQYSATSIPYWSDDCGLVWDHWSINNLTQFLDLHDTFYPRKYIVENFNLELKAREYVAILQPWQKTY